MASLIFPLKNSGHYPFHSNPNLKMFPLHCIAEVLQAPNHHTRLL